MMLKSGAEALQCSPTLIWSWGIQQHVIGNQMCPYVSVTQSARGRGVSGRVVWGGGVQVGQFGGYMPPRPSVGPSQAPLTSPCPPCSHTITLPSP